jgi:putative ABC transport system permease protein
LGSPSRIIGVVKNYHVDLLWRPITPLVLEYDPMQLHFANIRIKPEDQAGALTFLEATWKKFDRIHGLEPQFLDVQIVENYRDFKDLVGIIAVTAILAILIACLGQLGMAAYNTEVRVREIGIRKVLGASVTKIVLLLSRDFVRLIILAVAVASPLAWFINNLWLQQIAMRVEFNFGIIATGIAATQTLALIAIGSQTIKAALANPVESLRYE